MSTIPENAMVLAAGLGKRMRPITDTIPKPLVRVGGKSLLDWGLDSLAAVGVVKAVVNVHYRSEQIIEHVAGRERPKIVISDEQEQLLDSAGGIVNALSLLGTKPFYVLNADTFWIDASTPNLGRLALAWRPAEMDILLMLATLDQATGHSVGTDFLIDEDSRLRRSRGDSAGMIYAGAAIITPRIFKQAKSIPHSLNSYFDRAIEQGRLFGEKMDGSWITVGTPDAIAPAETAIRKASGQRA